MGSIDFSVLVPSYLSTNPTHASDDAKESNTTTIQFDDDAGTSDASYVNRTQNGETCQLYFADGGGMVASSGVYTSPSGVVKMWNVYKNDGAVIIKGNIDYGK